MKTTLSVTGIAAMILGATNLSTGIVQGQLAAMVKRHPPAMVILERARAQARHAGTASSVMHLYAKAKYNSAIITENLFAHSDFFVRLPLHERVRVAGRIESNGKVVKPHTRVWVKGHTTCASSGRYSFMFRGLLKANFPFNGQETWVSHVRFVTSTITYGVPTWFIQVTFSHDIARTGNKKTVVNEFVSQRDYKLVKLATYGKFMLSIYKGNFSIRERFGHYGEPLHIHLPDQGCSTSG